ncbi:hypothetical protein [Streptomyces sp. NL15-2K]|uniref:hypothetical protein n=1 Tax=Streptomyces sp. NL15-2K TaxID=376149 RepID=UPI000F57F9A8|nr:MULTISPECIES: hypothetical protein [Actinomycetes]WKX11059.1 hypothetical protein Q4V64_27540 [Kutzneria buriramensis]GCB52089.1 hypothetical protein SNL152K_9445 [Streptomyces sp. NL15-2K]
MNDQVARTARAAAEVLAAEFDRPDIVDEVEAGLYASAEGRRPGDYLDPVALGSLVVSVAGLAWTIYTDRRNARKDTDLTELVRTLRAELPETGETTTDRDRVITIVVRETIRAEEE